MSDIRVKICGVTRSADVAAAAAAGATYVGFNFFPRSPRYVDPARCAGLAAEVPPGICKVALAVDASDAEWDAILAAAPIDMLQLHGGESPERVRALKARHGLPVMKVLGIGGTCDLDKVDRFARVADQLLLDAKPPRGADRPGGNAVAFDWRLIAGRRWSVPWMLAGGLTPGNVAEAVRLTGARQVDVSSGVERAPGVKDAVRIADFVRAAQAG